ncbi:MAG TPA: hypothetical protein G4N93_00440 [Dehalococcoidia bacterium]|nr:hypothetical protein [Dehalococcoidia bacterium]
MSSKTFLKKSLPLLLIVLFLVSLLFVSPSTPQRAGVDPGDQPSWGVLGPSPVEAAEEAEPHCIHNVCVCNCLAHQCFLGWGSFGVYNAWFDTVYTMTGCDDSAWENTAGVLLSLAASAVQAPGAPTLSCWQLLSAQKYLCSGDCDGNNCRYAPNVHMSLDTPGEGYTAITVDNHHMEVLSEYEPTAYSRDFNTYFYLSYGEGQKLLLENWYVTSLSYPNWIIWHGLDDCISSYGCDNPRCKFLASFDRPSSLSHDLTWGGLIDLTGFTKNDHGIDSSPDQGYIALKSDGDSITIKKDNGLSGYTWVHNKTDKTDTVTPWNAYNSEYTVTNHECKGLCTVLNKEVDRDTYVFATEGPSAHFLIGDYTVEVEARLFHDKDINDNTVSYTCNLTEPPSEGDGGGPPGGDGGPPPIQVQNIGEGVHQGSLADNEPYDMYQLEVPTGLVQLRVTLDVPSNADFDLYMARGYEPRVWGGGYLCPPYDGAGIDETCELPSPLGGTYYIRVNPNPGSGNYTLTVEFLRSSQLENIGEGSHQGSLSDSEPYDMYHLYVPAEVSLLRVRLGEIPANANFDLYLERGRMPTETIFYSRSCNIGNMDETCEVAFPTEGDYYVMVDRKQGSGNYSLSVEFVAESEIPEIGEGDYQGNLSLGKPDDFYSLFVPSNLEQLRVHLEILDNNANFDLYLSKGRVPAIDSYDYESSSAGSADETCELTRPSRGRYYITVHRCEGFGDYNLKIDFVTTSELQEAGELENEPNDDLSTANQWDISKLMHGKLDVRFDDDRFQFVTLQSGLYTLHLTDVPANVKPDLRISTSSNQGVASDYSAGAGESVSLTFDANVGEAYFVLVTASSPSQISDQLYTLEMTIIPDPNEPDDNFDQATVWDFTSGSAHGYFWERVSGPSDWYVFTVPDSLGSVLLTVHLTDVPANVEPDMRISTTSNQGVASDYSAGVGESVSLTIDANAGETYYVSVKPTSRSQVSNQLYTLSVTPPSDDDTTPPSDDDTTPPSNDDITPPSGGVFTWDDIPIYPVAELVAEQSFSVEGWSRTEWRCYQTGDSESMVIAFYQSQMPTMGWQEYMQMKMEIEGDYSYYTKNQEQDTATVTIQSDKGPTIIAIMRSSR